MIDTYLLHAVYPCLLGTLWRCWAPETIKLYLFLIIHGKIIEFYLSSIIYLAIKIDLLPHPVKLYGFKEEKTIGTKVNIILLRNLRWALFENCRCMCSWLTLSKIIDGDSSLLLSIVTSNFCKLGSTTYESKLETKTMKWNKNNILFF